MIRREESAEMKILLAALQDGACLDRYEIATLLGVNHRTAHRYLSYLRKAKKAYVYKWRSNGRGPYFPVIAYGTCNDAVMPSLREARERDRRAKLFKRNKYKFLLGM